MTSSPVKITLDLNSHSLYFPEKEEIGRVLGLRWGFACWMGEITSNGFPQTISSEKGLTEQGGKDLSLLMLYGTCPVSAHLWGAA